jgi:hypothetical protein
MELAQHVDERGVSQIRSLIRRYGIRETLQAVFLEIGDIIDSESGDEEELEEAQRVHEKLFDLVAPSNL